jgi:hypothetical protein
MASRLLHTTTNGLLIAAGLPGGKLATAKLKPMAKPHKRTAMERNTKTQKRKKKDAAKESNETSSKEKTTTLGDKWQAMIEKHTAEAHTDTTKTKINQKGERT